ncbi:MAG: hypothetical protein E5V24_00325 [Mesorhizobium sp.]|nr:MAG: hypothetical protein E5V24_00325 [Mesorhizobium sp.]
MREIDANVAADHDIGIVMDNYANPQDQRHPQLLSQYPFHDDSVLAQPGRTLLANLTEKQIRRGTHRPTLELEAAIKAYIEAVNADPRPFRWTKSADDFLNTVKRICLATLQVAQHQAKWLKIQNQHTLEQIDITVPLPPQNSTFVYALPAPLNIRVRVRRQPVIIH